jgi:HSP20 family protein
MNIYEREGLLHLDAELPGVNKDDVKIKFEEGILSITAATRPGEDSEDVHYFTKELETGTYTRSVKIGSKYNMEEIKATYANGILNVTIPKKDEVLPLEIKVN